MKILFIFVLLFSISSFAKKSDLNAFDKAIIQDLKTSSKAIDTIYNQKTKKINDKYSLVAVYGIRKDRCEDIKDHKVAVYIVDNKSKTISLKLDVMDTERGCDYLPEISSATTTEAIVSFHSDHGELSKFKYEYDLSSLKFLKKITLPAKGIPDDLL